MSRALNSRMGIRNKATLQDGTVLEKKVESLLMELSETQQQPPLPTLSHSSSTNDHRTLSYFESIRADVNALDTTVFRAWRRICNEQLNGFIDEIEKRNVLPPNQHPQLVLLEDGSFAVYDGKCLTRVDQSTLPQVATSQVAASQVPANQVAVSVLFINQSSDPQKSISLL